MVDVSTFKRQHSIMFKEILLFNSKIKKTCELLYMEDKMVLSREENLTICGEIEGLHKTYSN